MIRLPFGEQHNEELSVWAVLDYPPNPRHPNGFSPRWYAFLRATAQRWPLSVVALHRADSVWEKCSFLPRALPVFRFWCEEVPENPLHNAKKSKIRRALLFVGSRYPAMCWPRRLEAFRQCSGERMPQLGLFFLPHNAHLSFTLPRATACVYVLEEALERVNRWQLKDVPVLVQQWVADHEARKVRNFYRRIARSGHPVVAISEEEKRHFAAQIPSEQITVIPHGVDCEFFQPIRLREDIDIAVIGHMGHPRNYQPALEVYDSVEKKWPSQVPRPRWAFVGKSPSSAITALACSRVLVTGEVPDVRPYYARAKVVLVPARSGSGTKTTVLQSWAMGRATVATDFSLTGLPARPGENVLSGESNDELAAAIQALLASSDLRKRIGIASLETVRERDIRRLCAQFVDLCEATVSARLVMPDGVRG